MDLTLGNNIDIGNQICIMVATQGDGTPLGPGSFKEQDMVQLCIGLDQEHPEDVLQLSDTEAFLAYWCETDMMAMMCHCITARVWEGEPIMLCILLPKGSQVREYIAKKSSHPSAAQMHRQGMGWVSGLCPACPAQMKGCQRCRHPCQRQN